MRKKFWAATFTLAGAIIGAGILGLPYVFAQSGFLIGIFWLVALGSIMIYVHLCIGEISLRTKGRHQLAGYAGQYLGKTGEVLMFFAMIFGIYSALLAYLVGEGQSLSKLLPGQIDPILLGVGFWVIMTLLLRRGLKGLKRIETYGVIAIVFLVLGFFIKMFPQIQLSNLAVNTPVNFAVPFGIVLFALLGFTTIPELRTEIRGREKVLKKAIILGSLIPIVLYIIFSAVFIGVLGRDVTPVATLSFGPIITILGIFTMLTSYFVLSFSLKDMFDYDLRLSKTNNFLFTSLAPLALYTFVSIFNIISFSNILAMGGVISGGLTGILVLLINQKSKLQTRNGIEPEIKMPMNYFIILILSILFIAGIVLQFI